MRTKPKNPIPQIENQIDSNCPPIEINLPILPQNRVNAGFVLCWWSSASWICGGRNDSTDWVNIHLNGGKVSIYATCTMYRNAKICCIGMYRLFWWKCKAQTSLILTFGQKRNLKVYTILKNKTDTGLHLLDTPRQTPTSHQCVPNDVTDRLLDYAQAVYWIAPLLTAIDQANNQLFMISKLE
ncbi:hypothetical protein WCT96_04640 [Pectobacterium carotovorum]